MTHRSTRLAALALMLPLAVSPSLAAQATGSTAGAATPSASGTAAGICVPLFSAPLPSTRQAQPPSGCMPLTRTPPAAVCAFAYRQLWLELVVTEFGGRNSALDRWSNLRRVGKEGWLQRYSETEKAAKRDRANWPEPPGGPARTGEQMLYDAVAKVIGRPAWPNLDAKAFEQARDQRPDKIPLPGDTPPWGRLVATCDANFGYTPVFSFGFTGTSASASDRESHLQCAATLRELSFSRPDLRPRLAIPARESIRRYAQSTAATPSEAINAINEYSEKQPTLPPDQLLERARACAGDYGPVNF